MANSISLLKPGLKTAIVEGLYNEIHTNTNNYYYFLGKTLEWSPTSDTAIAPQESLDYEVATRDGMIFLKKITPADISFTIPRYDWQSGVVFDKYDTGIGRTTIAPGCSVADNVSYFIYPDTLDVSTIAVGDLVSGDAIAVGARVTSIDTINKRVNVDLVNTSSLNSTTVTFTTTAASGATSLDTAKFYCITPNDNNVYKCIDNNGGAESTVNPYGISYSNITTSDGYVWKYMYTVPTALANKFSTITDIPVTSAIKNQYYTKGTIAATTIINPGLGYQPGDYLVVTGDGHISDNVLRVVGFNVDDPGYGYTSAPTLTVQDPYASVDFEGAVDHEFTAASSGGDLNVTTNTITMTGHGLAAGTVLYYNNNGNTTIGGLVNGKGYYVIVVDANTIKLATTKENQVAGTAVDLIINNAAMYGTHILTQQSDTYLIGQYVKYGNKIYQVTTPGTFSSTPPTHTSTEPVYNGTAALKFVGLTVEAEAILAGSSVDSVDLIGIIGYVTIQEPGAGYNPDNPPNITITGDGSDASAYATVVSGHVVNAIVSNKGTNYSNATVTIDPPVSTATATATVVSNTVTGISMTYSGSGYNASSPPAVTITGGGGSNAAATAVVVNGRVVSITVTNVGSGYTSVPTVTIAPPPNVATATATITGGKVTSIAVVNSGDGYDDANPPAVSITAGSVGGATASVTIVNGKITAVNVINQGEGYSTAPTVTIGPPGVTATAIAEVYYGYGYSNTPIIEVSDPIASNATWITTGVVSINDVIEHSNSFYEAVGYCTPNITFNATSGSVVNLTTNTITLTTHGFVTGDAVLYNNGGGTSIGGLTSGSTYYVVVVDTNNIKLASTYANAIAVTPVVIDLTTGAVGTSHYIQPKNLGQFPPITTPAKVGITAPVTRTFNPTTAVNTTSETITYTAHGFVSGDAVVYENGGGTSIGGLTTNTTYYVIRVDADTIKLATTFANAINATPVAINLTSVGAGTTHKLTIDTMVSTTHGFTTGDAVVYENGIGTSIGGLTDNNVYYVIVVDGNTIKLATTAANAALGTAIALKNGATGTTHTIQRVEVNGDFYLKYAARTASIVAVLQKTQAKVAPIIENGQIVGVAIVDGGIGYTTATITAYGVGKGAEIDVNLSVGDLNTNQATVELLAIPGTLDSIEVTHPGSGYSWARVDITGDGAGATATAVLSNGAISKIVVTNPGTGYTKANINIIGNSGSTQAYARPIISPSSGHGKNAVRELFAKDLTLSTTIAKNKNQGFDVDNDYRQIGMIKNPTEFGSSRRLTSYTGSSCYVVTGDFNYDEIENDSILLDASTYTVKEVVINYGGSGYTDPIIEFENPPTIGGRVAAGTVSINSAGTITGITITDRGTGYTSAPAINIIDSFGTGFQGTAVTYGQNRHIVVSKPITNPNSESISLLVQPIDNAVITAGQKLYINTVDPGSERTVSLVSPPTVNKYSGDLLYIDNRNAFVPSDEQTISIKTAIRL